MILKTGDTETTIEMHDQKVAVKLPIRNKDQSGDSTATDTTSSGTKAKTISVSGKINKQNAAKLTELLSLAEAEDENGDRVEYIIVDDTADAADVRTVIFHEDLDAREIDGLQAWAVTFSLREVVSVPELKSQRRQADSITAENDTSTTGTAVNGTAEAEVKVQQGTVYKILKSLDNLLAPDQ